MSDCFDHAADAWDDALFGRTADGDDSMPFGGGRRRFVPFEPFCKTCRYCGKTGLAWFHSPHGWRLIDTDKSIHSCLTPESNL